MMYFDNAATTIQKPDVVGEAMLQALCSVGNAGRGAHKPTLDASRIVYQTRMQLAELFGISNPSRIAFTANATEALNIAIHGLLREGNHVITSVCEHNSVLRPLYELEDKKVTLSFLSADEKGRIRYQELEKLLCRWTKAIVMTHVSNVTGNVTDLKRISLFAKEHGLLFIVDASQSAGILPINVEKMGIDVLCFTGHKGLMGPQGTGGIYVREELPIRSFKVGGSGIRSFDKKHPEQMPTVLEAGTLNVHGIAGLGAAVEYLFRVGIENIEQKERELANIFYRGIKDIPGIRLYGDYDSKEHVGMVTFNIGNEDSAVISDRLWEDYEICVRAGAHCAPLMHECFGTVDQGAVRFSFSYFNTIEEVEKAILAVKEIAEDSEEANNNESKENI
ncbi:MAG: aminotransferase class V-fold PLP-dependent enzyme [Lachnospiraceae bacterium]|nr:aminotransferase class V-fold PLP-dependent enzyme [Lachnospiraceae bacterium]